MVNKIDKICWSDLNWYLKIAVVGGVISFIDYLLSFLLGFFVGFIEGVV